MICYLKLHLIYAIGDH